MWKTNDCFDSLSEIALGGLGETISWFASDSTSVGPECQGREEAISCLITALNDENFL